MPHTHTRTHKHAQKKHAETFTYEHMHTSRIVVEVMSSMYSVNTTFNAYARYFVKSYKYKC